MKPTVLKNGIFLSLLMHYYLLLFYFIFYTRGKDFRKEFCSIGEVRSLIHENVQFMALTATATSSSRAEICSILGMKQPKNCEQLS